MSVYSYSFVNRTVVPNEVVVVPGNFYRSAFLFGASNFSEFTVSFGNPLTNGQTWQENNGPKVVRALYCDWLDLLERDIYITNITPLSSLFSYLDIIDSERDCCEPFYCGQLEYSQKLWTNLVFPFRWFQVLPANDKREVLFFSNMINGNGFLWDTKNNGLVTPFQGLTNDDNTPMILPYRVYGKIIRQQIWVGYLAGFDSLSVVELVRV